MIIPVILALTFLITSTNIPKEPVVYDLTTRQIYEDNLHKRQPPTPQKD